jgi:hypothetical protein
LTAHTGQHTLHKHIILGDAQILNDRFHEKPTPLAIESVRQIETGFLEYKWGEAGHPKAPLQFTQGGKGCMAVRQYLGQFCSGVVTVAYR